jgi:hypothetical protein
MAQSIISFQIRGDRPCCFYFELRFGVDGTGFQSPDIMGHAYDPVRIDPTQIGMDQSLGHEQSIRSRHTSALKDLHKKAAKFICHYDLHGCDLLLKDKEFLLIQTN